MPLDWPGTPVHVHHVLTGSALADLCEVLERAEAVVFDVETTGLDAYDPLASMVSISFTLPTDESTWVVPLDHPDGPWGAHWRSILGELVACLWKGQVGLVAHNAQFDLRWVQQHMDLEGTCCEREAVVLSDLLVWDTMAVAHLLDENARKALKVLAAPLMTDVAPNGQWAIDVRDAKSVPWFTLGLYNALDTIATNRLWDAQVHDMAANPDLLALWEQTVLPAARALTEVTHLGMLLDFDEAGVALEQAERERDTSAEWLMQRALNYCLDPDEPGKYISWEATAKWFLRFTEEAVARGDLVVEETTGTGRPSWRAGVLTRQARRGEEVAQHLLSYRHGSKQSQFIHSWRDAVDAESRVHPTFNIARTRTGRLSSSDPNMQQVARELKPCWRATPGWRFVEIDYSQIEVRIIAEYIHRTVLPDNPMMQVYREGRDIYVETAASVLGIPSDEVTSGQRQKFKPCVLGYQFGLGAAGFVDYAEGMGEFFTLSEAQAIRQAYFATMDGLGQWHQYQRNTAARQGWVQNLLGRRRRLPDMFSDNDWERSAAERQAINSPVQSLASDLMLHALGRIHAELSPTQVRIVGTVHDSVLLEARSLDIVEEVCTIMLQPPLTLTVPLEVEASIGDRWGEYDQVFTRSTLDQTTTTGAHDG